MSQSSTLERIATYRDVAGILLKYVPKLKDSNSEIATRFEIEEAVTPSEDAEAFARDLEDLGPTFVKIGQLLSTRSDLLPKNWLVALQRLQDDVDAFDFADAEKRIESELGGKIDRLFANFDEKPLACASLGQVHRATLRDGQREVVVKIQRPGIREKVAKELEAIQNVADFLDEKTEFGRTYDLKVMVDQFRKAIFAELNYTIEAENLKRLKLNLRDHEIIAVPAPIPDYCSPGILTMEYIDGAKITDLSGVVKTELDGEHLAESLFHAYLKQILIDGFFHADPHPGNVLLTQSRRLALIDLGMVGTVSDSMKDHLIQLLGAVADGNSDDAAKVARAMGHPRDSFQLEAFREGIKEIVESRQQAAVEDLQVGNLVMQITEVCGKNGLRIPESLFMIGKMLLNLDMIGTSLAPGFNPDASVRRHLTAIAQERFEDHFSVGSIVNYLGEIRELLSETPSRLNRVLEKVADDNIAIDVNAIDERKLLLGFHRVANRITSGIILAALIIGASMMMDIESEFTLFGYPGLAMIFFLLAAIGGLVTVGKIMFGNERE